MGSNFRDRIFSSKRMNENLSSSLQCKSFRRFFLTRLQLAKGQLISEGNFGVSNLPKNEPNFVRISALASKMGKNIFCWLFGRFEDTKSPF